MVPVLSSNTDVKLASVIGHAQVPNRSQNWKVRGFVFHCTLPGSYPRRIPKR